MRIGLVKACYHTASSFADKTIKPRCMGVQTYLYSALVAK
jgi:hypothetical protein